MDRNAGRSTVIRRQMATAASLDQLVEVVARVRAATVVIDVEPMVVPWDVSDEDGWCAATTRIVHELARVPTVGDIVFTSNSSRRRTSVAQVGDVRVHVRTAARKPFRIAAYRRFAGPVVVVGDQVLTDGILAARLGATFVQWRHSLAAPLWPRMQSALGSRVSTALFADAPPTVAPPTVAPEGSRAERLQVLLLDYDMCREDERTFVTFQATMISVAVAVLGLLGAGIFKTCTVRMAAGCVDVPDVALAAAPLLPLAIMAPLFMFGAVSTLRSYYMRAVEDELATFATEPLRSLPEVTPASYVGIVTERASSYQDLKKFGESLDAICGVPGTLRRLGYAAIVGRSTTDFLAREATDDEPFRA